MAVVPENVTEPLHRVTSHLVTVGECLRQDDTAAAARWLESAGDALGEVVDGLHQMQEPSPTDTAELVDLIAKARGRRLQTADDLRRADALLDLVGVPRV